MTKRVIEREQSIMGTIFFIFKVNTVEEGPFPKNNFIVVKTHEKSLVYLLNVDTSNHIHFT